MNMAFLADFFCIHKKFLIYNLIMRNLKIRYRKSLLGMMWTVLIPAGSAMIFYIVLKHIMRVRQENHFVFILSCQIAWVFFSSAVSIGLEAIVNNFSLLNKVPLPPQSLVLAETLTLLLNLILSLPILLAAMLILDLVPNFAFLQYFILLGVLALLSYSVALLLALAYVYLRDLKHLMTLILQFWFYLTPVLYTEEMIPEPYRWLLKLNPVGKIFSGFQAAMRGSLLSLEDWAWACGWMFLFLFASQLLLNSVRRTVVELA